MAKVLEFQLQHQSLLLRRYSKANRSGENGFFAIHTDPKTRDRHSMVGHVGKYQGLSGDRGVGNLGGSLSCGFYGKEQARQGKPPWDGLL